MDTLKFLFLMWLLALCGLFVVEIVETLGERQAANAAAAADCAAWNHQLIHAPTPDIYSIRPAGCQPATPDPDQAPAK